MKNSKPRHWYYKVLNMAKNQMNWPEDAYRDMLEHYGATEKDGKISATTMTIPQLEQAFSHMKSTGFKLKRSGKSPSPKDRQLAKIQALWSVLHRGGVMYKPYSDEAATKFAARHTKVANIQWATPLALAKTIEALKDMAYRSGVEIEQ